jgi:hypothetical protein
MPTIKEIVQAILQIFGMSALGTMVMVNIQFPLHIGNGDHRDHYGSGQSTSEKKEESSGKANNELVFENYNKSQN